MLLGQDLCNLSVFLSDCTIRSDNDGADAGFTFR